MRYLGRGRANVRYLALKTLALAVNDGDLEWSQTTDFSMFCALAGRDEEETRLRVFRGLLKKRIKRYERRRDLDKLKQGIDNGNQG